MLFCSKQFFLFFAAVFVLHWTMPWHRLRVVLLVAASFYFYASWNKWLALIICATTCMDYVVALGIERCRTPLHKKLLLGVSLAVNLGLLFYFKYANFFLDSLREALEAAGASASLPVLQVILPIGISFYTFEALNYTIDVYRGRMPAERNILHLMLFILFFPHLVAGPIVRAKDFLPQVGRRKRRDWPRFHLGVQFFLRGLFKKLAIADRLALYADPVFGDPGQFGTTSLWLATLAYTLQAYCDFSGYSDMAIGAAHMLGYKLAQNFNLPLLSTSISEFWRRWHISLSSWLRDYVFIPLGGSRGARWRTYCNLFITFTLCGMWHGATWSFVAFGVIHSLMLIGHHLFRDYCGRRPRLDAVLQTGTGTALRIALTFLCFALSLVIFRTQTLASGVTMLERMFWPCDGKPIPLYMHGYWITVVVVALGHALAAGERWKDLVYRLPVPVRGLGYATMFTLAIVLAPAAGRAFIYFQF